MFIACNPVYSRTYSNIATKGWRDRVIKPYICSAASTALAIVAELMQKGADVNAASESGKTPLFKSSQPNIPEAQKITKFLLLRGAVLYQTPRDNILALDSTSEWALKLQDGINRQPKNINRAIMVIRREYASSQQYFNYLTVHNIESILARMPNALAGLIMDFLPATNSRQQFLVNNGFIRQPPVSN